MVRGYMFRVSGFRVQGSHTRGLRGSGGYGLRGFHGILLGFVVIQGLRGCEGRMGGLYFFICLIRI